MCELPGGAVCRLRPAAPRDPVQRRRLRRPRSHSQSLRQHHEDCRESALPRTLHRRALPLVQGDRWDRERQGAGGMGEIGNRDMGEREIGDSDLGERKQGVKIPGTGTCE